MIKPMDVTPEVSEALASLRTYAKRYPTMGLSAALNVLDDAGVFSEIDERNDYASAEGILAESAADALRKDPAESTYEQLPDNFAELVDELSRPVVSDDGTVIPPAM